MELLSHSPTEASVQSKNGLILHFNFKASAQDIAPLFSGPVWGAMIWDASLVLCKFLEENVSVNGLKVLELGAGCGLPGILCALNGASETYLTDLEEEIEYANVSNGQLDGYNLKKEILEWGLDNSKAFKEKSNGAFDVLLASDCVSTDVYGRASWVQLCETIDILLKENGKLFVCSLRRPDDGLAEFLDLLKSVLSNIQLVGIENNIEIYQCSRF